MAKVTPGKPQVASNQAQSGSAGYPPLTRRSFFRRMGAFMTSHWLLTTLPIGGTGILAWAEHDTLALKLEQWDLFYPHLPPALEGKRIIQLSDLHLESLPISAKHIHQIIQTYKPDLLVLTGDLISTRTDLDKVQAYLEPLEARFGRYIVMGNNDYSHFSRTLFKRYLGLLRGMGWIPLLNEADYVRNLNLWVIGIDDPATAHDDVVKAYSTLANPSKSTSAGGLLPSPSAAGLAAPPSPAGTVPSPAVAAFRLALAHSTDCLDDVAQYGADLLLTGHTHGGQIRLPGLKPFITNTYLGDEGIYEGYHVINGVPLYINRGLGESVIPLRLNALPEITLFTLHQGNNQPTHRQLP